MLTKHIVGVLACTIATALLAPTRLRADEPVIYEVFVRNFSKEGTLAAVEARLDDIAELGVDVLWLMPIYPIGHVLRKGSEGSPYAVTDYMAIHPDLGSIDDLRHLVQATHERGMKLILDIVPNHVAPDHPWVAEHPDWVLHDKQGRPRPPIAAWSDTVGLNYANAELRKEMTSVLEYWIRECDIDGYRVDVAGMIPPDFWKSTIPQLRALKPGIIMLAEAEGPTYHDLGFDFCYDDTLRTLLVHIAREKKPAAQLNRYIGSALAEYPPGARLMRFTENHDHGRTAERFSAPSDRAAAAAVFTLPGAPLLYAGQEIGLNHLPNLFEKDPINWKGGSTAVRQFYKRLIDIRKKHPSLAGGRWEVLNAVGATTAAYVRATDDEEILVVLNFVNDRRPVEVDGLRDAKSIAKLEDLVRDVDVSFEVDGGRLRIVDGVEGERVLLITRQ